MFENVVVVNVKCICCVVGDELITIVKRKEKKTRCIVGMYYTNIIV